MSSVTNFVPIIFDYFSVNLSLNTISFKAACNLLNAKMFLSNRETLAFQGETELPVKW